MPALRHVPAMPMIYLDAQATTPCDPRVIDAMLPYFGTRFGNPHSTEHAMGREAAAAVDAARGEVAALIGAEPREIVFTSGATEANNLAIKGAARYAGAASRTRVITLATEHRCVLESVRELAAAGFDTVVLGVGRDGTVDPAALEAALRVPTLLVSVMAANNETGVIQDIADLAAIAHAAGALFHTDAAQAAGKVAFDVAALGVDLASLSAHKLYGPKGIGALYVRRRPRARLAPLFSGGGQERGLRAGTVPAPLVVGFGKAAAIAAREAGEDADRASSLRALLLERLRAAIPGVWENGAGAARLPGCVSIGLPGARASAVIAACPELCLSTGSACTSDEVAPSHVLGAMGLSDTAARACLRVGIGRTTSRADIDAAAHLLAQAHAALSAPPARPPVPASSAEA